MTKVKLVGLNFKLFFRERELESQSVVQMHGNQVSKRILKKPFPHNRTYLKYFFFELKNESSTKRRNKF